ncbi:MAG: NADP-dependent oxidoreductase [Chloroflexi bacterium]|nr:NADP-dependent oxidoreductase [Chloroflexota bacterium]
MRAMIINKVGGPEVLQLAEVPTPEPKAGEVLIRVACAGVNPADWKDREGRLAGFYTYQFPYIVGFDAAGVVAKVGPGVTLVRKGERVITNSNHGQGTWGTYAEYVVALEDRVAPLPKSLDFAQGAAIPIPALASWQALFDKAHVKAGQRLLIHGASGGVGGFAAQFAKWAGVRVAGTCFAENIDYVKGLGVDRAIDSRKEDIGKAVHGWAPEGVDLVLDLVGPRSLPNALDLMRPGGILMNIVTLVDDGDIEADTKAAAARGFTKIVHFCNDVNSRPQLVQIGELIERGKVRMPPVQVFPLEEAAQAHELLHSGRLLRGKLVLKVADL